MKKSRIPRFDLDQVYYLKEYKKAVAYAKQHIDIDGVQEQLDDLKAEKQRYSQEVSALVEAERGNEQKKYTAYIKWARAARISKYIFLGSIIVGIMAMFGLLNDLRGLAEVLVTLLEMLAFFAGAAATIITILGKSLMTWQYKQYIKSISGRIDSLGNSFTRISESHYSAIDSLYLNTLDPTQRELILLRRDQAEQSKKLLQAEKERQQMQETLIKEQRRTRAAQEELLAIEREREARRKKNGW